MYQPGAKQTNFSLSSVIAASVYRVEPPDRW
jgi:hypothetical protein